MNDDVYPQHSINRRTTYRVPPGWVRIASDLIEELSHMQKAGHLPGTASLEVLEEVNGALAARVSGLAGGGLSERELQVFCSAYYEACGRTCADCGYPTTGTGGGIRPLCPTCRNLRRAVCP